MTEAARGTEALLLSREWRDGAHGLELSLWGVSPVDGPVHVVWRGKEAVFFVRREHATTAGRRVPTELRTLHGQPVDAVYFRSQRALREAREALREAFESDVKPVDRFLMERFVTGGFAVRGRARRERGVLRFDDPELRAADVRPPLSVLSLDIETDGWDGPLLSVALVAEGLERVFLVRPGDDEGPVSFHRDERSALLAVFEAIRAFDPDVLVGWNVVEFDLRVLEERARKHGLPFAIGRAGAPARILPGATKAQVAIAKVPGRVVLDGIATLKNATWSFERYTLDHVARALLGRGKAIAKTADPLAEIRRMFADDPQALATYNLEDARLVLDVVAQADLVSFAVERAYLTGLPLDRQGGAVAAFDHLYLPRLHRRGFVAPDVAFFADATASPGGYVLESVPGLYRNVLAFDFRSLYPSIIRTFQVDPLGLLQPGDDPVPGFEGAWLARHDAILPDIVKHLAEARARAQAAGNEALQRAIKILMNSLYGVLGTPACRFFDARLASSITMRGHEIIETSRSFFEELGVEVIYGDTDSLFLRLPEDLDEASCRREGARLASLVNDFWRERLLATLRLPSHLEMRFDAHYLRFLMPTMRGQERGSKKRYAGLVRRGDGSLEVVVRGLEAVRSDWTPLARNTQRELLRRVFEDEPWADWLRSLRAALERGELDDQLVYRRRLRRSVDAYESAPPHVKAARLIAEDFEGDAVEYVITTRGAEPTTHRTAPIDHAHYVEKQLSPAVDVVLPFLGTSFDAIAGPQLRLF